MYETWQAPDIVTAFGTLLAGAAACSGAFIASLGLNSWKRQAKWQTDRELARAVFVALRKRQDAIYHVRNPFGWSDEYEVDDESIPEWQRKWKGLENKYQKRWDKLIEVRQIFYPVELEGDALWGEGFVSLCAKISNLERELLLAIQLLVEDHAPENSDQSIFGSHEEKLLNRRVVHARVNNDEFGSKYDAAVADLKSYLRQKLENSRP